MRIIINDEYAIEGDIHGWMISRRRVRKRNSQRIEEWTPFRWYNTLEVTVRELAELQIRTSDAQTLAQALAVAEKAVAGICEALQPQFKVIDQRKQAVG